MNSVAVATDPGHEVGSRAGFAHDGTLTVAGSWKEHVFYAGGYRDDETARLFPKTAAIVDRIHEATGCALCGRRRRVYSVVRRSSVSDRRDARRSRLDERASLATRSSTRRRAVS